MEINDIDNGQYLDIFATPAAQEQQVNQVAPKFGSEEQELDIFKKEDTKPEDQKPEDKPEDIELDENGQPKIKEVDLLGDTETNKPGRKPKYAFEDAVGYFEDRFKTGKFVKVIQENEKGEEIAFIPKTPEEFDEVIDIQVNHRLEEARKTLDKSWYDGKPAAWQAVAKYAEMVDNPADIIPFIQGVQTIESVAAINEEEIEGAESIVRTRLEQRGDSKDIIDDQIELLKTTDKLIATAKKYKPLILNDEKVYLGQMKREAEQQRLQFDQMVTNIRTKAVEAIEAPIFGKQKLKNEEKALIYDLIAQPDQQSQGYKIYSVIDKLFEEGKFDVLKKIALLATNETSLLNYLSIETKNATAASLQSKLRVASENRGTSNLDAEEETVKVQRNRYVTTPRFGR